MVLDFNAFMRQRTPRLQFGAGDFGVNNLAPQAQQFQMGPNAAPGAYAPPTIGSPWQAAGGGSFFGAGMNLATAGPPPSTPSGIDPTYAQGQQPPVPQYQTQNPDGSVTTSLPGGSAPRPPTAPHLTGGQARTGLGQANAAPTPSGTTGGRFLADWAYGGDQLGGGQYVNGAWRHGAPIAAGTDLGTLGIATRSGYRLPVGYDSRGDTARFELNGRVGETSWSRAIRKAQDMVINGQADWDSAIRQSIALVNQEAAAQGKTTGFDMASAAPGAQPGADPGAAPPAGATGGTGGGGGAAGAPGASGGTDDAREFLMDDPRAAFRELMRRRGYGNLDSGGYAMQYLQSRYEPALQAFSQVASGMGGEDAIANETFDSFLNNLRGGSLSRYARDVARQAYGDSGIYRAGAGDEANQAYYENLNYLDTLGSGGLVQRSEQNRLKRYMNQYGDIVLRTLQGEAGLPQTFEEFMRQNGYSIFR